MGQLTKIVRKALQKVLYANQWFLMVDWSDGVQPIVEYEAIVPPKDRSWADPHVLCKDDRYYIFVEELIRAKGKAHISVLEFDGSGRLHGANKVLERAYHLSYPFVFEWGKKLYMIPETADNRTIELYECIDFPHMWQHRMNLMEDIDAVDTTVLHHRDKWWLFTNIAEYKGASRDDELFLFFSKDIESDEWTGHPLNPVVSDVRNARPAGKIFDRNGSLIRPAQDCSKLYGYGLNFNEITTLTETEYEERLVGAVRPDWDKRVEATHTFAHERGLTVIDAFTRRRRLF